MTASAAERTQVRRTAALARDLVPWRPVLLGWTVSRILSVVAVMVLGSRTAPHPDITRLVMWDGGWYQIIAHQGYGPPPPAGIAGVAGGWTPWPFFPLYPGLVRGLHILGSTYSLAQVVIANAAALAAMAGVWRIARRHISPAAATYAVWITALFPGALTFAMGYPDSLFLAGSVWAFALLEERKLAAAGLLAMVATAARPNGFVILVALAVAVLGGRRVRDNSPRELALVLGPAGAFLAAWCTVCWYHTGDPFVFLSAKSAWAEFTLLEAPSSTNAMLQVALAVALVVPFLLRIRRQPPAWVVLVALSLLPSLALGVVGLARYAAQCFPLAITAGAALERVTQRASRLVLAASAVSLVGFALLVTRASYVP